MHIKKSFQESKENITIKVFDLLGNIVYEQKVTYSTGKHQILIDTEKLNTENYYYTIFTKQAQITSKLMVVRN